MLAPQRDLGERRSRLLLVRELRRAGIGWKPAQVISFRCALAVIVLIASLALIGSAPLAAGLAYAAWIAPAMYVERSAHGRTSAAERALVVVIERADALVSAGRPPESAFASLATHGTGAPLLDGVMRRVADAYALGAPLYPSLALEARREGVAKLADLATELERSRDLGRGSLTILHDARDAQRADERVRSLDAAAQVEGRLMLVLVLCYMPALMLAVVIPLFLGLLDGLLR
ncbi:MAG: type II secretion system F family protein [Chloroflexi bacterium]|nr:type II secretion system F family protein [Chloroflexota bacterium]